MRQRSILIVDDNPAKLAMLKANAESADPNASVATATSARKAKPLIARRGSSFDKVIMDYDLPREAETGADLIRQLRTVNKHALIVLATARAEGDLYDMARRNALDAGADETFCTQTDSFGWNLQSMLRQNQRRTSLALAA